MALSTLLARRTAVVLPRGITTRSMAGTPPKTQEGANDGTPSSYNIPPKESTDDRPLPKSQDEHPGPVS